MTSPLARVPDQLQLSVTGRFVAVSAQYQSTFNNQNNSGANYRFLTHSSKSLLRPSDLRSHLDEETSTRCVKEAIIRTTIILIG